MSSTQLHKAIVIFHALFLSSAVAFNLAFFIKQNLKRKKTKSMDTIKHSVEREMDTKDNLIIDRGTNHTENGEMKSPLQADDCHAAQRNEITFEYNGLLLNGNGNHVPEVDNGGPETKDCAEPEARPSLFVKFRNDLKFRHRLLHTACVGWTMVALGWRVSLIGPTFPDLRLVTNEDLSTASWLFTAWALGGLLGSVLGGAVYDRFNKIVLYIALTFGLATSAAVTPWITRFPIMFVLHLLGGGFGSAIDAVGTTDILHVWRHEGGPYMQAVHFGFSVGAIVSPFIAGPFLAPKIAVFRPQGIDIRSAELSSIDPTYNGTGSLDLTLSQGIVTNYTGNVETTLSQGIDSLSLSSNLTQIDAIFNMTIDGNASFSDILTAPTFEYGETRIYVPYSISTIVSISAMFSYVILYFFYGNLYKYALVSPAIDRSDSPKKKKRRKHTELTTKLKAVFVLLQSCIFLIYFIIEKTFIGYLMTFLLGIGWNKPEGASATSVMWIAFASGRFAGIFIVRFMTQTLIIFTFIGILGMGIIGLWIAVVFDLTLLTWASVAIFGLGMSVMFASIFSWLSVNVIKLTGKITSVLFIVSAVGTMLFPLLTGALMSRVSYQWYIYLLFMLVCTKAVLFGIIAFVYKFATGNTLQ